MQFTEADLDNLSTLARLTITAEEKPKMLSDMQAILGYVSEINNVEAGDENATTYEVFNVVRDDVVTNESGVKKDAILDNAPKVTEDYIEVLQVLK